MLSLQPAGGRIYESDITRGGLLVWKLNDSAVAGSRRLSRQRQPCAAAPVSTTEAGR
jgi:hypothetical protein